MPACAAPARKPARWLVTDEAVHPIRRHYTPSDRVYRDVTGVSRRNGCSASCSEPGGYFEVVWLRLMLPIGCVGSKCLRLDLFREVVHPMRRHYTPSDRVYRDGSGAAQRIGCSAARPGLVDAGMCSASEETRALACCR